MPGSVALQRSLGAPVASGSTGGTHKRATTSSTRIHHEGGPQAGRQLRDQLHRARGCGCRQPDHVVRPAGLMFEATEPVSSQPGATRPRPTGPDKVMLVHAAPELVEEIVDGGMTKQAAGARSPTPQCCDASLGGHPQHGYRLSRDEMIDAASSVAAPFAVAPARWRLRAPRAAHSGRRPSCCRGHGGGPPGSSVGANPRLNGATVRYPAPAQQPADRPGRTR